MILKILIPVLAFLLILYYFRCNTKKGKCSCFFCLNIDKRFSRLQFFFVLILALLFIFVRDIFIIGILIVISAIINIYQGRLGVSFDLSPSLVIMVLVSMKLGFLYGLLFLLLGSVIPSVLVAGFNYLTFLYVSLAVLIGYLASLNLTQNYMLYGISLIFLQSIFAFFLARLSADPKNILSVFVGFTMNIIYLMILGNLVLAIL